MKSASLMSSRRESILKSAEDIPISAPLSRNVTVCYWTRVAVNENWLKDIQIKKEFQQNNISAVLLV